MRFCRTRWLACALAWLLLALPALAKDAPAYPEGASTQDHDGRTFELRVPKGLDPAKKYSLLVMIDGSIFDFEALAEHDFIVCNPQKKFLHANPSATWAGSAIGDIHDLVEHLLKRMPIDEKKIHLAAVNQSTHDIGSMLAFSKKARFVSATFVDSAYFGGSVAKRAKKEMGVLWYGAESPPGGLKGPAEMLDGKVRTFELRQHSGLIRDDPYFLFWLRAMEGEFTPGVDHSFAWEKDERPVPEGKDRADLPPIDLLEQMRKRMTELGQPGLVYFFAKSDAENPHAKQFQNVTFMSRAVRVPGREMAAVKLDAADHAEGLASFDLDETPAIVLLDHTGKTAATFEGKINSGKLAKAMAKLVAKAEKAR